MKTFVSLTKEYINFRDSVADYENSYRIDELAKSLLDDYKDIANSIPDDVYIRAILESVPVILRIRKYRTKEIK